MDTFEHCHCTCDTDFQDTITENGMDDLTDPFTNPFNHDGPDSSDVTADVFAPTTTSHEFVDLDGDGYLDAAIATSADGSTIMSVDTDGDGLLDTMVVDSDGDGFIDSIIVDTDGDGLLDTAIDENGNTTDLNEGFDDNGEFTNEFNSSEMTITDTPYAVIDEDTELDDDIHGEPKADIEFHQAQPGPVDCLPTSVAMVLSDVTGEEVLASDVVATAHDLNVMTDTGMAAEDGVKLFEEYGVDAELSSGTLDDIREALDNGDNVVIGLDSADLYAGEQGPFDNQMTAGHAIEITGIDDEAGVVYINDPGFSDGAGVEIPIEVFEDAWEDADNTMITVSADQGDDAGDDDTVGGITHLLPLNFRV